MSPNKSYRYQVVDVFTQTPLEGNPLAVFSEAAELDPSLMQKVARELMLPETVFIVPSRRADCLARLRIFTPSREMDFAGHPTLGAGFVLARRESIAPGDNGFSVEENVGVIPITLDSQERSMLWLRTPCLRQGPTIDIDEAATLLSLSSDELWNAAPQVLSAGNPTLFIALKDKATVDKASLNGSKWEVFKHKYHPDPMCAFAFTPTSDGAYSRMFAPDYGISEDPATGSSTGPLAFYMMLHGMAPGKASHFVSEQGTKMGRKSILHVRVHGENGKDGIDVGGFVTPVIEAEIRI